MMSVKTRNSLLVLQALVNKIRIEAERMDSARLIASFEHDCNSLQMTIDNADMIVASGERVHNV